MRLSDFELDVMMRFWEGGPLSAPALYRELGETRGVTYSTIKTIVDRLEAKGAIERTETRGKTILYRAAVGRERIRKPLVKSFLRRLFGDDLRPLFTQLFRDEKLSDDELAHLRRLVEEASERKR